MVYISAQYLQCKYAVRTYPSLPDAVGTRGHQETEPHAGQVENPLRHHETDGEKQVRSREKWEHRPSRRDHGQRKEAAGGEGNPITRASWWLLPQGRLPASAGILLGESWEKCKIRL